MNTEVPTIPTVYFDGSCPLCRREISLYQRAIGGDAITWCDVSQENTHDGLSREQAMARFHVRDANGKMASGARAFIALWLSLPRWRWLGKIASLPPLPWILEGTYRLFLLFRPALQRLVRRTTEKSGFS